MLDVIGALLLVVALASAVRSHARALTSDLGGVLASASCLVVALLLSVVALTSSRTFRGLLQEDGPAEWATVFAFGIAALLYARRGLRRQDPWLTRLAFTSVALFCVFVAGEEISWGQRLFAIEPPALFLEHNFQQELNVHNLLTNRDVGGLELDTRYFLALLALFYGGLLPLVRPWLSRSKSALLLASAAVAPPALLAPSFLVVAAAELAYPVSLTGEAAELVFGLCFVATGALLSERPRRLLVPALVGGVLALGGLTPVVVDRVLYGSDEERVALASQELEQLARDLSREGALSERRLEKKRSVHKRVFTAGRAGYFRLDDDDAAGERQRWFLDPWSNPYWIAWSRKHQRITLYSFGPDRRRSGRYDKSPEVRGDDIAVHLEAPWKPSAKGP